MEEARLKNCDLLKSCGFRDQLLSFATVGLAQVAMTELFTA